VILSTIIVTHPTRVPFISQAALDRLESLIPDFDG
jgi:hypothetical protein